jgi:hypothetical protein
MKTALPPEQKNKSAGTDSPIQFGSPGDIMFERIWALLVETQLKNNRHLEEVEKKFFRKMEENNRQLEESGRKYIRRMEEKRNRYIEEHTEKEDIGHQTRKKNWDYDSLNEFYKNLICTGVTMKFDELGYRFDDISCGGRRIIDKKGNTKAEIDIILENTDCITGVKIITKPGIKNIDLLAGQLKVLREHRSKYNDKRKIYGAIAGAALENEEKQAALNAGIFVFEQAGVTLKACIPQGFIPHYW